MASAAGFDSRSRKYHMQESLSFCTLEEDMADPNSYFDIALPLQERASGHRPSKSSSDSKEFDFSVCMTPPDFEDSNNISPADELFYKGKLLPLYMSQRLQMSKNLSAEELKKDQSSIAFSCYLHSADVDIDMVLEPTSTGVYGDESTTSSSRNSRDKDSSADSSSRDSSEGYEEAPYGFRRSSGGTSSLFGRSSGPSNLSDHQQVLKNDRFRWKLLLGHRRSSKVMAAGFDKSSCGDKFHNVCKSCGQQRKSEESSFSTSERRSLDPFPSSPHLKSNFAGIQPARSCVDSDKFYIPRHSTGGMSSGGPFTDASQRPGPRNAYQSVFRAKEFWRKYLKPFISRTSQAQQQRDAYSRPPEESTLSGEKSSFKSNSKQRGPSRSTTPLASPTHSGVLSAPIDDVQGAIAYCKQSRASSATRSSEILSSRTEVYTLSTLRSGART